MINYFDILLGCMVLDNGILRFCGRVMVIDDK